ncbi:MAG: hypothetical protein ABIY52_05750 [Gemmatimonadaceae bacterium]
MELDFVIVASADEVDAALTAEPAFDVIILDQYTERIGGLPFLQRLRQHSPDAERLIVARQVDERVSEMLQSDCRVMRVLQGPFSAELLCRAVEDALLRHRARALRAMTVPRVTPMDSGHGCVV